MPKTRQTIIRLLSVMASAKEIDQYLKRFAQLDAKRFAVVNIDDAILRDKRQAEAVASSLSFLQEVGLTPIVLLGAAPHIDGELSISEMEDDKSSGSPRTSREDLALVRQTFQSLNLKLVELLQQRGARATAMTGGVFEADYLDRETYGLFGKVCEVNLAPLEASLSAGSIPVISSLGKRQAARFSISIAIARPMKWCRRCNRLKSSSSQVLAAFSMQMAV